MSCPKSLFRIRNVKHVSVFFKETFVVHTSMPAICCPEYVDEADAAHEQGIVHEVAHEPHMLLDSIVCYNNVDCSSYLDPLGLENPPLSVGRISSIEGKPARLRVNLGEGLLFILCNEVCEFGRQLLLLISPAEGVVAQLCANPVCFSGHLSFLCWNVCTFSKFLQRGLLCINSPKWMSQKVYHDAARTIAADRKTAGPCHYALPSERTDESGSLPDSLEEMVRASEQRKFGEAAAAAAAVAAEPVQLRPTPSKRAPKGSQDQPPPPVPPSSDCCRNPSVERGFCSRCHDSSTCRTCSTERWQSKRNFRCFKCMHETHKLPRFYDPDSLL